MVSIGIVVVVVGGQQDWSLPRSVKGNECNEVVMLKNQSGIFMRASRV
jgi:hypothetical protein